MSDKPKPMWPDEKDGSIIGYMCMVDFECELGMADHGVPVYSSQAACERVRKCIPQCGMVEVRVTGLRVVQEQNFDAKITDHSKELV